VQIRLLRLRGANICGVLRPAIVGTVVVAVLRPSPIGGSDARGIRQDGSDGISTTVNMERSLRAVACTGLGGSHHSVFVAERRRSTDSVSS